jgi:hypothetical protein
MKNTDAVAEFLLKEVETKESIRKKIDETAWDYYTGRHLFGLIAGLSCMGFLLYVAISRNVPVWGIIAIAMAMTALMESKRNSGRVDDMMKLSNVSESEPVAVVNASAAAGKSENQLHD